MKAVRVYIYMYVASIAVRVHISQLAGLDQKGGSIEPPEYGPKKSSISIIPDCVRGCDAGRTIHI